MRLKLQKEVIPFHNGNDIYIAYSAGVDSLAVAYNLRFFNPIIYHVNHSLSSYNDGMEESAKKFANDFNLRFKCFRPNKELLDNVKGLCDESSKGYEHGARQIRIEAWRQISEKPCTLVVCHHLDDYAESHLMNFLRGKADHLPMPIEGKFFENVHLVRPNLLSEKQENIDYVSKNGIDKYVFQDPSNFENRMARNRIRKYIPELCGIYNFKKKLKSQIMDKYNEIKKRHNEEKEEIKKTNGSFKKFRPIESLVATV